MRLWVAGALLLAVGGTVVASNMAFKLVPNLNQTGKIYAISLPLNNNYTDANSIFEDINAACGPLTANKVEKINPSPGGMSRTFWLGFGSAAQNFSVNGTTANRQQGYLVQVNNPCTSWAIVGSHDPTFVYNFAARHTDYLTTIPYHTTQLRAEDLYTSIPLCNKLERINVSPGGTSRTFWLGFGSGTQNFPVKAGEAYIVLVHEPLMWIPSHYCVVAPKRERPIRPLSACTEQFGQLVRCVSRAAHPRKTAPGLSPARPLPPRPSRATRAGKIPRNCRV